MRLTTIRKELRFLSLGELRAREGELETFIEETDKDRKDRTLRHGIRERARSRYMKARSELVRVRSCIEIIERRSSRVIA